MSAGDSNSDLYACTARALTTAPPPQFTCPAVFKGASVCSRASFDFASISETCLLFLIISYSLQFWLLLVLIFKMSASSFYKTELQFLFVSTFFSYVFGDGVISLILSPSAGDWSRGHPHARQALHLSYTPTLLILSTMRLDFDLTLCSFLCEIHKLFEGAAAQGSFL